MNQKQLNEDLKKLFKSMDFVSNKFLQDKTIGEKDLQIYSNIYQQLGLAWEFLGLQCKHHEGYKKTREKKEACMMCGKIKGVEESYYLLPKKGIKKLGRRLKPNSRKTFKNKNEATLVNDTIDFHGAFVNVDVHNSYKSKLLDREINIADERIVSLKESGVECSVDQHMIHIKMDKSKKSPGKKVYGGFPWEIKRQHLKNFPVIFDFDENYQFLGLSILR
ncbi:MAG: hypothetical protein E3K38_05085 [Candidatus Kuenenia stuttgartiensis]|nr:hypothetical protein [Candidatus Kuenenia stuttgartiensis]